MTSQSIVRKATPEDRNGLWDLLRLLHKENGMFAMSEQKVNFLLDRLLHPERIPEGDMGLRGFIGVIGPVGKLEGMIIIALGAFWYSDDIILEEYANFVHPDHRRSNHAKVLLSYGRNITDQIGVPLIVGIISNIRTEAKVRLYRRILPETGSFFIYQGAGHGR